MKTAIIDRHPSTDDGTFGLLATDGGFHCVTGELPDRNNQRGLSCINAGTYICEWMLSPTHGWCYHVTGVPGRSEIEIHSANFCGDSQLGKKCELRGCLTLGEEIGPLSGQKAVLRSKATVERFNEHMNRDTFQLIIRNPVICDPEISV